MQYRPIYNPSAEGRTTLARHLTRFSCAMARHLDSPCPAPRINLALNPLKTCILVVTGILDGSESEVTPSVRKAVYVALTRSVRHQTIKCDGAGLEYVAELAAKGMRDIDRNVRLSAG